MSNGQTTQSQSMGVQTGQVANFYFGPPQGTQDMTIGGATPSNYTAAAKDSSSADVKATSFALQSEQQIQKDVKEVQQLESEAKSPKNEREDLGFRNKVANKLAQEVALKNALIGWILTIQAKRTAFHLVSDGTPDSTDKVAQGTSVSGSGTPGSTGGSSTTPSTTSSTTPTSMSASTSLTSPAATYATGSGLSASATQAIAQAVAQAQQAIAASTAANQQTAAQNQADAAGANPASVAVRGAAVREVAQALTPGVAADAATTAAAEAVVASFETSGGGTTDRLRTLTLQVANDPSAFGVTSSTDQAGLYDALATYGAAKGW